jgi:hypothetical protein
VTFTRQDADNWAQEVPGARWLKADLHIHTVDDIAGRRAKFPADINGNPQSSNTISAYARRFLQSAAERGVRVLGITPHSPRVGTAAETSVVWRIVEEWNSGVDDDGVPFREKVYAVFPGFEPSFNQGRSGLHLLFLFDPEIGRDDYLKTFDLVMGGMSPWDGRELRLSGRSAGDAFNELREYHRREGGRAGDGGFQWNYMTLAPHIDQEKGLLGAQGMHVLNLFPHSEVAGLELGDEKLPEDYVGGGSELATRVADLRQAFYHSSDAYRIDEIGKRYTWLKLASPRIEALRQAFIASDSRIRIGYERCAEGGLSEIPDPPDVTMNKRPWLKSIKVSGKASFFGASGEGEPGTHFELSPDLTCIIGGSMTGKSTLLDGLRVHIDASLPQDGDVRKQVEARGKGRFLGGSAEVVLDCPGRDPTAAPHEQWPAVFYTQTELQRLAQNPEAVEDILARLVATETQDIGAREKRLVELDKELARAASRLAKLGDDLADAEQAFQRSQRAATELAAFSDAGVENLNRVSSDLRRWRGSATAATELASDVDSLLDSMATADLPEIEDSLANVFRDAGMAESETELRAHWDRVRDFLSSAKDELNAAKIVTQSITGILEVHERVIRVEVDRELAARGLDGARINQLQALNVQASLLGSYQANFNQVRNALTAADGSFETLRAERQNLVDQQRDAFDRVIETVHLQFDGQIAARRINDGREEPLDRFFRELSQRGITRWWNDLTDEQRPTPDDLLEKLHADHLEDVWMSKAVQETFLVQLTPSKRRELASLRCRDRYVLEFKMGDGSYRVLDYLSGGQQVNLLLSLLLETNDERPLVIDQPEDELDNRFLFETMLPTLKRLKGRRQIIVATHNANIVVNGDADQVIQLEATADRGHIARSGAIEEPAVRDAIVQTVDGGDEAFRLRRLKYGF